MVELQFYLSTFPIFHNVMHSLYVSWILRPFRWSQQKHKIGFCRVSIISLLHVFSLGHDQGEHVKCKEGATEVCNKIFC